MLEHGLPPTQHHAQVVMPELIQLRRQPHLIWRALQAQLAPGRHQELLHSRTVMQVHGQLQLAQLFPTVAIHATQDLGLHQGLRLVFNAMQDSGLVLLLQLVYQHAFYATEVHGPQRLEPRHCKDAPFATSALGHLLLAHRVHHRALAVRQVCGLQ